MALTLALLRASEAAISAGDHRDPRRRARLRVVDVLPRLPDYLRCFALMAIPAVATTMAIHFLRTATNGEPPGGEPVMFRAPLMNRWFADSPLEVTGFEPSVPLW